MRFFRRGGTTRGDRRKNLNKRTMKKEGVVVNIYKGNKVKGIKWCEGLKVAC